MRIAGNEQFESIIKMEEKSFERMIDKEILLRSKAIIKDKTTLGFIHDLYFRIDRNFSDSFIKNLLLSIKNQKASGIIINSEDNDESQLMVTRVRNQAKKTLDSNIY